MVQLPLIYSGPTAYLVLKSRRNNGPKAIKRANKALILHGFGFIGKPYLQSPYLPAHYSIYFGLPKAVFGLGVAAISLAEAGPLPLRSRSLNSHPHPHTRTNMEAQTWKTRKQPSQKDDSLHEAVLVEVESCLGEEYMPKP